MDYGFVHGLWTLFLLLVFVAIVVRTWSGGRRRAFDEAARMALQDDLVIPVSSAKRDIEHG